MKKKIYIYQLFQQGNIGTHQIEKIDEQPDDGFENYSQATRHLEKLFKMDKYPFGSIKFNFTILEVYAKA